MLPVEVVYLSGERPQLAVAWRLAGGRREEARPFVLDVGSGIGGVRADRDVLVRARRWVRLLGENPARDEVVQAVEQQFQVLTLMYLELAEGVLDDLTFGLRWLVVFLFSRRRGG